MRWFSHWPVSASSTMWECVRWLSCVTNPLHPFHAAAPSRRRPHVLLPFYVEGGPFLCAVSYQHQHSKGKDIPDRREESGSEISISWRGRMSGGRFLHSHEGEGGSSPPPTDASSLDLRLCLWESQAGNSPIDFVKEQLREYCQWNRQERMSQERKNIFYDVCKECCLFLVFGRE